MYFSNFPVSKKTHVLKFNFKEVKAMQKIAYLGQGMYTAVGKDHHSLGRNNIFYLIHVSRNHLKECMILPALQQIFILIK